MFTACNICCGIFQINNKIEEFFTCIHCKQNELERERIRFLIDVHSKEITDFISKSE